VNHRLGTFSLFIQSICHQKLLSVCFSLEFLMSSLIITSGCKALAIAGKQQEDSGFKGL
jgi:hypothetical protein